MGQHCLLLMDMVRCSKKVRMKVNFRKKLKLWRLRESEVKEEFVEGLRANVMVMKIGVVSKEICLMQQVKLVVKLKTNPHILRRGGGIKMWILLYVERESSLGFGNRVKNEEDRKKHCDTKKMLRE